MQRFYAAFFLFFFAITACQADDTKKQNSSNGDVMTNPTVKIETTKGDIVIQLDSEKAPLSTENFIQYVQDEFYKGTIFHRVIPGFMIQGGGMLPNMSEKSTRDAVKNEANNGLTNDRGTIAMARTNAPHSATSQFFINVKDNAFLNHTSESMQGWGYAVFGKVTEGMDVVDVIVNVPRTRQGYHDDVPVDTIEIKSVTVVE